ncbi:addiction module antitoxin [Aphanothece sacrum FPU3]|nr:addiction module antitoxin [Aphanothece sacrum FPU3]
MQNEPIQIQVAPEFKRSLGTLAKRYRNIRSDVQPIIDELQASKIIGEQIPGIAYTVFKVRVRIDTPAVNRLGGLTGDSCITDS